MPPKKKKQGKRKSRGGGVDIFEVDEKDLSPEPEEICNDEPQAKVLKTRNSDVTEARHDLDFKVTKEVLKRDKDEVVLSKDDLSDEPEHIHLKINKESRKNDEKGKIDLTPCLTLDLTKEEEHDKSIILITDDTELNKELININRSNSIITIHDDTLEDGEVNDTILDAEDITNNTSSEEKNLEVTTTPSITIKFSDKPIADIYMPKFVKFIQSFIEFDMKTDNDTRIDIYRDVNLDPREWVVLDNTVCLTDVKEVAKELFKPEEELAQTLPVTPKNDSPKKKKKKKKQQKDLFVLDTQPGLETHKAVELKYSTKFLINEKDESKANDIAKPSSSASCFNCGNEHSLKDCPHPKNYAKINANRQKMLNSKKSSRYHLEEDQKYGHLQPGKLSPDLRKALGLKKNELPSWIYQMRVFGYPPGWLEEAKFIDSQLAMFDAHGNNVKNTNLKKVKGLDPEKIINYPGFNVPMEKHCKDDFEYHNVAPYSEDFNKEKMMEFFKNKYLREEDNFETEDMDLDNTNDLNIDITEEYNDSTNDSIKVKDDQMETSLDSDSCHVESHTLNDLESEKKKLLEQLKKSEEAIPWDKPSKVLSVKDNNKTTNVKSEFKNKTEDTKIDIKPNLQKDEVKESIDATCSNVVKNMVEVIVSEAEVIISSNTVVKTTCNTPLPSTSNANTSANTIKVSSFGTPILKSASPYSQLPNPDNFMVGVSPVIDFENLPNSTGKYEQMTGVLQKVRDTLKNLHKAKT